jgi:PAS domain S-box-containing protein
MRDEDTEAILAAVSAAVVLLDADGLVTGLNPAAARLTGDTPDTARGRAFWDAWLPHEDALAFASRWRAGLAWGAAEGPWRTRDGAQRHVRWTTAPRPGGGAVLTATDMTDHRALDQMKDDFIGVMSHELRTPLTAIHGSLGLLATDRFGHLDPRGQRLLELAIASSERLVRLINDALDLERLEAGLAPVARDPLELRAAAHEAIAAMQGVALLAGVRLHVDGEALWATADPARLMQVFVNLLANAIQHSPAGGAVTVSIAPGPADMAMVSVRDEGPGVPPALLEAIFERFRLVDASDTRHPGGLGLGLALCRAIVQRHGGTLRAESRPGEGATFTFTLPRADAP